MPDHAATVSAIYEAFGRGDIPAILDCLAEDVQWEAWSDNHAQRAGVPWLAPRTGRHGAAAFFEIVATFGFRDFQVLGIMAGDGQVAVEISFDADLPNGARLRDEEIHLWTFNPAGKVIRFRHYADTAKHCEAARKVP